MMNEGDCRCIRYIDDFVVLAPSIKAANARFKKASKYLQHLGMSLSREKTTERPLSIAEGFEFLGVEIRTGLIRPTAKARAKFLESIRSICAESTKALVAYRNGQALLKPRAFLGTLKQLDGAIQGWGKHYRFCNDKTFFTNVDRRVEKIVHQYLNFYNSQIRDAVPDRMIEMLGIEQLGFLQLRGNWPKAQTSVPEADVIKQVG